MEMLKQDNRNVDHLSNLDQGLKVQKHPVLYYCDFILTNIAAYQKKKLIKKKKNQHSCF